MLSTQQRVVLELAYFNSMTQAEIARQLRYGQSATSSVSGRRGEDDDAGVPARRSVDRARKLRQVHAGAAYLAIGADHQRKVHGAA